MSREKGEMKELPEANKTQVPDVIRLTGEQDRSGYWSQWSTPHGGTSHCLTECNLTSLDPYVLHTQIY